MSHVHMRSCVCPQESQRDRRSKTLAWSKAKSIPSTPPLVSCLFLLQEYLSWGHENKYKNRTLQILDHWFIDWSVCLLATKYLVSLRARKSPSVQAELDLHSTSPKWNGVCRSRGQLLDCALRVLDQHFVHCVSLTSILRPCVKPKLFRGPRGKRLKIRPSWRSLVREQVDKHSLLPNAHSKASL
jgi:hypothetical protein